MNLLHLLSPSTHVHRVSKLSLCIPYKKRIRNSEHSKLGKGFDCFSSSVSSFSVSVQRHRFIIPRVSGYDISDGFLGKEMGVSEAEDFLVDEAVFQKTLRLVECSMFAAVTGLAYFLSNSLSIEKYFGCFFPLPIVISSMRWGLAAGRKTLVATALLLLILSGPIKALTYLLMHGCVGLAIGSLWRLRTKWSLSIALCTLVRAMGALGYVLIYSFLIRENILALITINVHASLSYIFASIGVNIVPSMDAIYTIFGSLLLLNNLFFIFLLHIFYAVFFTKLGMRSSLTLPGWLDRAM